MAGVFPVGWASVPRLCCAIAAIWHESVGTEVPPTGVPPTSGTAGFRRIAAG
ncbi:DUF6053 domain-containing protein, partial [Lysobacter enzymogenes]|uniref:DUF6053 domain-containing protein n=1 Tax=Lysobacter enzymogenes TaxID=69 RepID=UPI003CCD80F9